MSETPKKLVLDAALREWPELEKSPMDWEEMARTIDERVRTGEAGASVACVSNENLLAEPLGQIEGEGHNSAALLKTAQMPGNEASTPYRGEPTMTMPVDRERDRRSLQDLAKMASQGMTPPPPSVSSQSAPHSVSGVQRAVEAKKDDSGIVDLAMAAQSDPHAAVRAQITPLASDGLFDDEPASIRPGPVSSAPVSQQLQQPAPSMPPFAAASVAPASLAAGESPASVTSPASRPVTAKKKGGAVLALVFGGIVAASAVAAGGFLFVQHQRAKAAEALAMNTPAAPVVMAAAPAPKPAETAAATPAPEATLDPNALPSTPDPKLALAPKAVAKGGAPAPVARVEKPAAPVKEEGVKLSQKDLPTAPSGPEGDLGKAMGAAVGADGKPLQATPAAGNTGPQFAAGSVPQKPSQGAVTGALGAVLPGARACLGPDDAVSRAAITFTSAGTVQSVNVTGGAAGKPAEGCIKAALSKAKVTPFAEATYTAPVTIRH